MEEHPRRCAPTAGDLLARPLPLMKPGIANAFLIGFIESMADFGNPLVLAAAMGCCRQRSSFAVVGSQNDPSRAAVLAIILLCFTLTAFPRPALLAGRQEFRHRHGKGDSGSHIALPRPLSIGVHALVVPWMLFNVVIYGMILFGGFVKTWVSTIR